MTTSSPTYIWWNGLLAQVIEGTADSFKIAMGGSVAGQMAHVTSEPISMKQLGLSMVIGAGLYAANYLKLKPLPTVSISQEPQLNPPPAVAPDKPAPIL